MIGTEGIELRRTDYDLDAAAKLIAESGYPAEFDVHEPPPEAEMLKLLESAAIQ